MRAQTLLFLGAIPLLLPACGSGNETSTGSGGAGATGAGGAGGAGGTGGSVACPTTVTPGPGTTLTLAGPVTGAKQGATWAYKGIPFAAPPVGPLRWKRPQPHACWADALPTTAFGAKCTQLDADGKVIGQEDCLTLNVWTPEDASPDKPAPVLFFLPGGGNVQGGSAESAAGVDLYDGQALAEAEHAVIVTINYRLGPFGWFSHPNLAAENPEKVSGNYGAFDQLFALGWVHDNIAAFGGDPAHVLVFGESAGALNTCLMVTTPLSKGLFSAALMQSGGCAALPQDDALAFGAELTTAAGCNGAADPVACLRDVPTEAMDLAIPSSANVAGKQGPYQPSIDGYFLPKAPMAILDAGEHQHVPLVVGSNENETGASVPTMTEAEYQAALTGLFGALAGQVAAEYPVADYPSPRDAYVAVTSDAKFICTARRVARAASKAQSEPVYRYQFTHVLDNVGAMAKAKGAFHGLELFFVFNHLAVAGYQASAGETDLALAVGGYWARFAAKGDPNGNGAVVWPTYDAASDPYLELATPPVAGDGVHTGKCDFWDSFGLP